MLKERLLDNLLEVEKLASSSKAGRFFHHPIRYLYAILFREIIYKSKKEEKLIQCKTFFEKQMHVYLPSSTDIYLTKGKSHLSEIKLSRFLINKLGPNNTFLDIGAHYGFFSLLAKTMIGPNGKVFAYEASPKTFEILKTNLSSETNFFCFNKAISDKNETISFYEFPNLYSEFNTVEIDQFENSSWFKEHPPQKINVEANTLDNIILEHSAKPHIIKIDVEGAEYRVLSGGQHYLKEQSPILVMEFLSKERNNEEHIKAEKLLKELGYRIYSIDKTGELREIKNANSYLSEHQIDSDNLVFVKSN